MSTQLGFYSLFFGLIISLIIIFQSINCIKSERILLNKHIYSLLSIQLFFVIFSFSCLTYSFIVSDFSNEIVYLNSHTSEPLFYKFTGVWGNHEGSLLLWLFVLTFFNFLFIVISKNNNARYKLFTIFFQQIIIFGFFLFIIITSNPFNYLYPKPIQGMGLNPILQDPALAIHPPLLYIGYVGTSLIFSSSLAALVCKYVNYEWAKDIKKWIYISWIFLTVGIMLGSIWAYYELGWGGFWFWDPVENVSLMPWFCLTALMHSILVLERRNTLKNWTVLLSIATFSLSMSGTFLVRSGILNSIHTFANDPSRGLFILIFLFVLILLAIVLFFYNSETDKINFQNFNWLSKETAVLINNWFMMYFLSVVFIGTVYPIFLEILTNEKISVGPPFYQKLIVPFLIPFFIFMSIGPRLKWIKDKFEKINVKQIVIFIFALIISYSIIKFSNINYLFATILITTAIYLLLNTVNDFYVKSIQYPQKISHLAFSILLLSILLNGVFSKEFNSNMKIGDEIEFLDKKIKFESIKLSEGENYKSLVGFFEISKQNNEILEFSPEIRIYNQPVVTTSEADIKTTLMSDNFVVFSLIKDEEIFNVRYQYKPFMIWIWISSIILAIGGGLAILKK